jgi:Rps23 Pro-64 3,4-dihydroxylase Tpa1-like proline 4-hydroxylase
MENKEFVELLESWIGLETIFEGKRLRVIEVLNEGPSLVVEELDGALELQENAYGFFEGFAPKTYVVPVFSSLDRHTWHPLVQALLA